MTWGRFGRIFAWSLATLFLILLSLLASISAIVATEPGSRWVIAQAERFLPIEVGEVRGNLLTGLDLAYIDYHVEENGELQQSYRAEKVSFRWQPFALLYSAVSMQSLSADNIDLLLPPATDAEPAPTPWPSLALPVSIELGEVQLNNLEVARMDPGKQPQPIVTLRSVSGSLSLGAFHLRLNDLAVVADTYTVITDGRVALRYPYAAQLDVQWQFEIPVDAARAQPELYGGRAQLEGNIQQLDINHNLVTPLEITSLITVKPNLTEPPEAIASLAPPFVDIAGEWATQPLVSSWFPAGADIPVVGGKLRVQGWIDDYQAELDGQVSYANIPPLILHAKVRGDLSHVAIAESTVQVQDAENGTGAAQANVTGEVIWTPQVSWDLAVKATDLDPSRYFGEWPGNLQASLKTSGGVDDAGLRMQVEQLDLHGQLRALEVRAEGSAAFDGQRWQSDELLLAMGANHLRVQGSVGEQFDLKWRLDAPLLTQIDTNLEGSLFTSGKLQGTRADPQLQMETRVNQLRWQDYALRALRLDIKPGATGYQLSLDARNLELQQQRVDNISLQGSGSIASHTIQGQIDSEAYGQIELALDSGYSDEQWQGQFTELELRLPGLPRWWLLRSNPMSVSAEAAEIGELCLTTRTGRRRNNDENDELTRASMAESTIAQTNGDASATAAICASGQWRDTDGVQLQGSLDSIPLRQLRSFLKPDVALSGFIEGDFNLSMPIGEAPVAQANLRTRDGELSYQYADLPMEIYRWENAVVTAEWKDQLMRAQFTTDWARFGNAEANVSLNTENQQLAGKMHINFGDLAPLAAFIPFADDLSGQLAGDIEVNGSIAQPQLSGQLTLAQGAAKVPQLGVDLRDLAMTLTSYGDGRIELRSNARSGEGQLTLRGDLEDFGTPEWQLLASVNGEKFHILEQPELKAQISPAIELRANQHEIRITGDALIPWARAEIKTIPATATRVSEDVVIEEEGRVNGSKDEIAIYLNVNAELGKDVMFSGFGLNSRLAGKMSLIQTPTRPLLITGYVDVVDGKYEAYGQELTIERGRLIFQGPYDNPGLDIRAQRSLRSNEDHIVGLEIGGTLQNPTSRVYSNPTLENEGEAMALLLTGKPLSEASAGDAYAIVSAMRGTGMDKGGSITGQIADAFNLDEFKLSAEDGLEHSSLWVGKYLTDRLFVRYIVGLFDQVNKVGLTYQVTDRLRIEGESGEIQSVDMIYKIER